MAEKKAKFKPFPKTKSETGRSLIDYEKLKQLYLDGPDYDWTPFCERHGFNSRATNRYKAGREQDFNLKDWKREWITRQVSDHDVELAPQVLEVRKQVSITRIKFVKEWNKRAEYMLAMLDSILSRHGQDLKYDQENAGFIAKNPDARRFKMEAPDLEDMASAALKIQELQTKALLIVTATANHAQDALEERLGEKQGDLAKPVMQISTMGHAGLNAAESAKILAAWFDQAEQQSVPAAEEVPDEG